MVVEGEINNITEVVVFCDGASRGNPGPAAYGFAVADPKDESDFIYQEAGYLGTQTNNYAEYTGVLAALHLLQSKKVRTVTVKSDSQLLVRQLQGMYRVKAEGLKPLFEQAQALAKSFKRCQFIHIPREQNAAADDLANRALNLLNQ